MSKQNQNLRGGKENTLEQNKLENRATTVAQQLHASHQQNMSCLLEQPGISISFLRPSLKSAYHADTDATDLEKVANNDIRYGNREAGGAILALHADQGHS